MSQGIDTILSAIEQARDPLLTRAAIAQCLGVQLPKDDGVRTIDLTVGDLTRRVFIGAIEPIVQALELDPQSHEDAVKIEKAQILVGNLEGILAGTYTSHYGIRLPATTNTAEIEKVGDAIHQIWQDTNSYRTRYKDMRINGEPVTDKESYLKAHSIPLYYHDYYKLTKTPKYPEGILQEDIKRIPNSLLCKNNSVENSVGAQSYIQQLGAFLEAVESGEVRAQEALLECLRKIHTDWYERNASWTIPYGEPATYDQSSIETKYNGTRQLFEIAKHFGALEIPEVEAAFFTLMDQLKGEKFSPFLDLSISDSYSAMTRKTGLRPTILGDAHVAEFFDRYFTPLDFCINRELPEPEQIDRFLQQFFPEINGVPADRFEIKTPSTAPGSGARVYLILDKEKEGANRTVAVLKIQTGTRGLDEIVSNVAAFNEVPTSPNFTPVGFLSTGKIEGNDYFVLLDVARKFEAESVFRRRSFDECTSMVSKAARSLATLHGEALKLEEYSGGDLTTFKGNCWYDVRQLTRYISMRSGEEASPFEIENLLPQQDRTRLQARLEQVIEQYSDLVENRPALLSPSAVHGDMHGGNLFIADDTDLAMLIDYGGVTWTIGKKFGTGDRGNDLGRFIGSIFVEGVRCGFDSDRETRLLIDAFTQEYLELVGLGDDSARSRALHVSAEFYAHRYIAVNAQDTDGKKYKPVGGESVTELRQKLFDAWVYFKV